MVRGLSQKEICMRTSFLKLILRNTLAQGFGKGVSLVFGLATTLVLRRTLERTGYGQYFFIISLVTILVTLADFGTHLVGVREATRYKRKKQVLGNVIFLRSLFSLGTVLILFFLFFTPLNLSFTALLLAAILLPLLSFRTSLHLFCHARLELEKFALLEAIYSLFFFLLVLLGRMLGKGVNFFLLTMVVSNGLALVFFAFYYQVFKQLEFKVDKVFLKKFFQESLPMGGILVLFTLYSRVDSVLLKIFKGEEAVGIYGLSFKIYENLTMPAAFLMNAYLPLISKEAHQVSQKIHFVQLKRLLKSALTFLLIIASVLIVSGFAFSSPIVRILAGKGTEFEVQALRLLLPAILFASLNHLTGYTLLALGQQRKSFLIALVALVFNFLANLILIPSFSFKAAALNTVLTEALVLGLSTKVMFNHLKRGKKGTDD